MNYLPIGKDDGNHNVVGNPDMELREQDRWLPIANVARLMKNTLPATAKVSKDAKECMQECVSEFISFITSEASDKCVREKRKTINGEDILYSLHDLGFENYAEVLKIYLAKYREQQALKQERGETRGLKKLYVKKVEPDDDELGPSGDNDQEAPEEQTDHATLDSLAYTASPSTKDVQSPDYFQPYAANQERINPPEHMLEQNLPMESKKEYRYGDFINEESDEKKTTNVEGLTKLGETEIDTLTGLAGREYY